MILKAKRERIVFVPFLFSLLYIWPQKDEPSIGAEAKQSGNQTTKRYKTEKRKAKADYHSLGR